MTDAPTTDRREMLREALTAIDGLQTRLDAAERAPREPIAIIGLACRFPGSADSPERYWDLLRSGTDAVTTYPADRAALLAASGVDPDTIEEWPGGFVDGIDRFDPAFFGISPREAMSMDPQQRMVLETSWEALERAAIAPDSLRGSRTGIFLGITGTDYVQLGKLGGTDNLDVYSATGGALNAAPGRVAFTLGLQGPSLAIDTACSSSLVAIHQACASLRTGESSLALAGGVNLLLLPEAFVTFERWGMMAPDGRCKTFDAAADGFVRSEGCGMLVLKRLSDALADGDPIAAVIRGSAVNQDGASSGLTVPNGPAQEAVIRAALERAEVAPHDIQYFEAHGTGTTLGDPIEVEALGAVLGAGRGDDRPLRLGSVKTNLGHLESAAGVAGVIKVVLAMQHGEIPPHLHLDERSPRIPWPDFPIEIPTEPVEWAAPDGRRFAGVSGFGFSGTNAHIVLESAPPVGDAAEPADVEVIALTAASESAVRSLAGRLAEVPDDELAPAAAVLAGRRADLAHRLAFAATDAADARATLTAVAAGETPAGVALGTPKRGLRVGFVYSGQGSQYAGMASELITTEPVFAAAFDDATSRIDRALADLLPDARPLRSVIDDHDSGAINRTGYTQPAIFAVQYALTELLASWGIRPAAVLGHSIGEIAAAVTAGVFDLDTAVQLVTVRGALMDGLPTGGAMAAVTAPPADVEAVLAELDGPIAVAALNGAASTVVSGRADLVAEAGDRLAGLGRVVTPLEVSHAFHSPLMTPMLEPFRERLASLASRPPTLPMASTVTGAPADDHIATLDYWVRHITDPVRFTDGLSTLVETGVDVFVEVGPHPVLTLAGRDHAAGTWIASLRRNQNAANQMASAAAALHVAGAELEWTALLGEIPRAAAPTTPFDRRSHWFAPVRRSTVPADGHPLLGPAIDVPSLAATVHQTEIAADMPSWLGDHRLGGTVVFPGTAFLETALAAAEGAPLASLHVRQPLVLHDDDPVALQTTVTMKDGRRTVTIGSNRNSTWSVHAEAVVADPAPSDLTPLALDSIETAFPETIDVDEYYAKLRGLGLEYGPAFTSVRELRKQGSQAIGRIALDPEIASSPHHLVHPALLDCCFHVLGIAADMGDETGAPVRVDDVVLHRPVPHVAWCRAEVLGHHDDGSLTTRIEVFDAEGQPALEIGRLEIRPTPAELWQRLGQVRPDTVYELTWRGQERSDQISDRRWIVAGESAIAADLADALGSAAMTELDPARVIAAVGEQPEPADIVVLEPDAWQLTAIAQHLFDHDVADVRIALVTRGAVTVDGEPPDVAQAATWGCGGSLAAEIGGRWAGAIDLDPTPRPDDAAELAAELTVDRESAVALRAGRRFVPRVVRPQPEHGPAGPARIQLDTRGSVDALTRVDQDEPTPGPGEIVVEVRSTGLNFRDVLNVLGMFPGDPGPPGLECSGVVTQVGAGVDGMRIGDRVVGIAPNAYDDFVVTDARLMTLLPANAGFADGASLPIAFLTATYGLERLADLQSGERVLIHAGTGGVGMAAIQVAQRIGAEIFATAGSDHKRALLRELGVGHVYDSRSLDFAAQIRDDTGGVGVDVALNSLADDFASSTFDLMAEGGRFLEIGKRGILSPEDAAARRPDVRYHPYDLADFLAQDPTDIQRELDRVVGLVGDGSFAPLPVRAFPRHEISDAFRFMAQARHVGKVVVDHGRAGSVVRDDATYLVTGGLGGLGLAVASWLADEGAPSLVLASRRAPDAHVAAVLERLEANGTRISTVELDVADADAVERLVASLAERDAPLRGIVHAAGVNDDGAFTQQTEERFAHVAAAKVGGTQALDRATRHLDLDWFVAFSSASAIFGSAGQTNYAAANRAMDAVMLRRRSLGLPALTVNWGAWADAGMATRLSDAQRRRLEAGGIRALPTDEALDALRDALTGRAGRYVIGGFEWSTITDAAPDAVLGLFEELSTDSAGGAQVAVATIDLFALLDAEPPDNRRRALQQVVVDNLTAVLGLDPREPLDPDAGLTDLGMDSLMAVELSNRLSGLIGTNLASTIALEHPSVRELTEHLVDVIGERVEFGREGAEAHEGDGLTTMDTEALTSALLSELDDVGY